MGDSFSEIFSLLQAASDRGYIGEPVSQLEHALQGAALASRTGDDELVLAALLHDIGHLCAPEDAPQMEGLGILKHEDLGAEYLRARGFSPRVCALVAGHVPAKRYLARGANYAQKLSGASAETLKFQGGVMSDAEAQAFERDPLFKDKLQLRSWDEQAKRPDWQVPDLASYAPMFARHLAGARSRR
jgi:putative nucleotidyltransferase with HDIG domain